MDAKSGLPPFRVAVDRARQIAIAANDPDMINADIAAEEEYEAVKKARELSRFHHKSAFERVKVAAMMALEHRKAIKEGDLSVFIPAFVFAIAKDGFLDLIPGLGQIFGFPVAVYLFIFCWGKGTWKIRMAIGIISMLDLIPAIGMLPMSTISIFYIYHRANKKALDARTQLKDLEKSM